jgi:hypothetical protein
MIKVGQCLQQGLLGKVVRIYRGSFKPHREPYDGGHQCDDLLFQRDACQDSLVHVVLPWTARRE